MQSINRIMLSVIIPTCNRNDMLAKCLKTLAPEKQDLTFEEYEVIVTDDGKSVTAEAMILEEFPWVKWVKGPQKGPGANRNNGVKFANGEWIVFTDDDCLPDTGWLKAYSAAIKRYPEIKVFEGRTYAECPQKSFAEIAPINKDGGTLPSCNFLIDLLTFQEMNGFDEEYDFSFEDMDLHYRLKKAGFRIHFIREASVCHPWRKVNKEKVWRAINNQKAGMLTFISKHPGVLRKFNSIHFFKEAVINLVFYNLPMAVSFKGAGLYYILVWRYLEILMGCILLPKTSFYFFKHILRKGNLLFGSLILWTYSPNK